MALTWETVRMEDRGAELGGRTTAAEPERLPESKVHVAYFGGGGVCGIAPSDFPCLRHAHHRISFEVVVRSTVCSRSSPSGL